MIIEHGNTIDGAEQLTDNTIIGELDDETSTVTFKGKNNILFLDGDVKLSKSNISFLSNDAIIYLTGNEKQDYKVTIECWRSSFVYIGGGNFFSNTISMIASERKGIIIGGGGVFSFGLWIRTADPHILYDAASHERVNPSKDVLIGDHVWLGQNALILKGTAIGSGSVVAAGAVLAGKRVESNTVYAGNPARKVKDNVFFSEKSVHNYTEKKTRESMHYDGNEHIYNAVEKATYVSGTDPTSATFEGPLSKEGQESLFQSIHSLKTSEERLEVMKRLLGNNTYHNRFSIVNENTPEKRVKKWFFGR